MLFFPILINFKFQQLSKYIKQTKDVLSNKIISIQHNHTVLRIFPLIEKV